MYIHIFTFQAAGTSARYWQVPVNRTRSDGWAEQVSMILDWSKRVETCWLGERIHVRVPHGHAVDLRLGLVVHVGEGS